MEQTRTDTYMCDKLSDAGPFIHENEEAGWAVRQVVVHQAATQRCVCILVVYERPGGRP